MPFMRHLTLTLAFSQFSPHYLFPFDPRPIFPSSSSLHHCHSASNFPAIAAFPRTMFPTANLYSGRTHLSPGSVRSAALSVPDSLAVVPAALGSLWIHLNVFCLMRVRFEFGRCELRMRGMSRTPFWRLSDMLHLKPLILTYWGKSLPTHRSILWIILTVYYPRQDEMKLTKCISKHDLFKERE